MVQYYLRGNSNYGFYDIFLFELKLISLAIIFRINQIVYNFGKTFYSDFFNREICVKFALRYMKMYGL